MTGSLEYLHNVHTYNGTQSIQVYDGNALPLFVVGKLVPLCGMNLYPLDLLQLYWTNSG